MGVNFYSSTTRRSSRRRLLHWRRHAATRPTDVHLATSDFYRSGFFFFRFSPRFNHVAKCEQDDYSFALKIILCIVSHWAVGAHDLVYVESPIGWSAEEALTGALGALNPEFNGDLSDHFGSDAAKGYSP